MKVVEFTNNALEQNSFSPDEEQIVTNVYWVLALHPSSTVSAWLYTLLSVTLLSQFRDSWGYLGLFNNVLTTVYQVMSRCLGYVSEQNTMIPSLL